MPLFHHHKKPDVPPPPVPQQQAPIPAPNPNYRGRDTFSGGSGGGDMSAAPGSELGFQSGSPYSPSGGFGIIQLAQWDCIRILGFPESMIPALRDVIQRVWVRGIQAEGVYRDGLAYEWKLHGNIWRPRDAKDGITARRTMMHIFNCLGNMGWHLTASTDLSRNGSDKDTLFFRLERPLARYFWCICFNWGDRIRIIDAPNAQVTDAVIDAVRTWPKGVMEEKWKEQGCYQFKMKGDLWWVTDGRDVNQVRLFAARLLSTINELGYELVGTVEMTANDGGGDGQTSELDTWFFSPKLS